MPRRRPFNRTDRLSKRVMQVLAVACHSETREDTLRQVVITGVDVTRDLSLARVHYYPMSGEPEDVAAAFVRATGFLRKRVGEEVRMRVTPELRFQLDESIDSGRRVEEILAELDIPPEPDEPAPDLAETPVVEAQVSADAE